MTIMVPPIKCQGIKTKLVEWIESNVAAYNGIWYEPFMGSGVVGFNIQPKKAVFSDTNPHIIRFYNDIKEKYITSDNIKDFLRDESIKLLENGDDYYKEVRKRFNISPNSFDFIFLNRCCFNGIMRFNSKGEFNVPFCKKNNRLSKSYITKISKQIKNVSKLLELYDYQFIHQSFAETISMANQHDLIYCDPPYIDRYSDYFNDWTQNDEENLFVLLSHTPAKFILSTWHHNKYRENIYIEKFWRKFRVEIKEHFYHVGAKESNRNSVIEALVCNY